MSSNVIYTKIEPMLMSCKSLTEQRDLLELILMNMLTAINTAAQTGQFEEYKLDTGQTKSEIRYRDLFQLQKAYQALFMSYRTLTNELEMLRTGRSVRLVNSKNFPGRGYFYGY